MCTKFNRESESKRILKIGPFMIKSRVYCFFETHCRPTTLSAIKISEGRRARGMVVAKVRLCEWWAENNVGVEDVAETTLFSTFCIPFCIFVVGGDKDFKFGRQVDCSQS